MAKWLDKLTGIFGGEQTAEDLKQVNPHFSDFVEMETEDERLEGVLKKHRREQQGNAPQDTGSSVGSYGTNGGYHDAVYSPVSSNKIVRLRNYRQMGDYPEVDNATDEIADQVLNYDDRGEYASLIVRNRDLSDTRTTNIETEFDRYINLFDLEQNFFNYTKTLLTDGELAFEHIVNDTDLTDGVLKVQRMPNETYDFFVDEEGTKTGVIVFDTNDPDNFDGNYSVQGNIRVSNWQPQNNTNTIQRSSPTSDGSEAFAGGAALPFSQITYIDSGIYSSDGMMVYPVLEKARKAYRQLTLIEDSIIIYRIARSPERLVFNVPTGRLPRHRAEQAVEKMAKRYNTKRFYNPTLGTVSNDYDPYEMIESFFIPMDKDGSKMEISSVGSSVQWTELPDLEYFQKKLYMALKIPFGSRMKDGGTSDVNKSDTITAEERRFAKFVLRIQERFAAGFTKGFKSHLQLRGLWDQYNLNDGDVRIKITAPTMYELYEQQQLVQIKFENYSTATKDHPEFSKEIFSKLYLGMDDAEWREHQVKSKQEAYRMASIEFDVDQIGTNGNPHPDAPEPDNQ